MIGNTSKQVGTGVMVVGAIVGGYGMRNVLGYIYKGEIAPLMFGHTPMPFSSACGFVLVGWMGLLWLGWDRRRMAVTAEGEEVKRRARRKASIVADDPTPLPRPGWTPQDVQKVIMAGIGLLSAALMVWGGLKK